MIVYRFSHYKYSKELNGEGASLFGGRWNSKGVPVVYTSFTISLALLELLIHAVSYDELSNTRLTYIEIPEKSIKTLDTKQLKQHWIDDIDYTRFMGDEFITSASSLLLSIPSAIIPEENNILINPKHPHFSKVKIREVKQFRFDARLFKH